MPALHIGESSRACVLEQGGKGKGGKEKGGGTEGDELVLEGLDAAVEHDHLLHVRLPPQLQLLQGARTRLGTARCPRRDTAHTAGEASGRWWYGHP